MKTIEDIKKILLLHKNEFREKYNVKEIGVFGSYVKNKNKRKSDVDILVEFDKPVDFFLYLELEERLSKILKVKVDLVMKKALKPGIGKYILQEVVYV